MERTNRNYAFVVPFVSALAGLGLRHACITPGSRSTPLALAFAAEQAITDWVHLDERSSAFFALGMARATGRPVAVVCTSGSAAAEFHPAAVEARQARVPLLLLTADRPPELRDAGAPQTMDQVHLFGSTVKWFHDAGPPPGGPEFARTAPALAARAWAAACDAPAGPVHVNFRFRDPLHPVTVPGDAPDPGPLVEPQYLPGVLEPDETALAGMAARLSGRRALVVCGPQPDPALPAAVGALAGAGRFPVIADALSGVRAGPHDLTHVVATGGALAAAGVLDRLRPEVVLRIGGLPTSKPLYRWLAANPGVPQVLVDPAGWRDPDGAVSLMVRAEPAVTVHALAKAVTAGAPPEWAAAWRDADDRAAAALRDALAAEPFPNEPEVARIVATGVPAGSAVWVASSMPVRDVDTVMPRLDRDLQVVANRGVNGIDGFLSSGFGWALAGGDPTYLLAGDLSFLHDLTALAAAARLGVDATVVVVDNDGGGIFHFLPQATHPAFERLFGTPHGTDLVAAARALGAAADTVTDASALREAVAAPPSGVRVLLVPSDRAANVAVHDRLREAVAAAVG